MVHETSEINYYMGQNEPHGKPRLHTVTARVDKVLFPDGSELGSSDQLLTTEDLTTLAAQLSSGLTVTDIAGGASYATSEDLSTLEGRVDTLAAATNTPQSEHNTLKGRVDTLAAATNTPQSEHESLLARVAASELTNTALISQLQSAVELLSAIVIHHRAALDDMANTAPYLINYNHVWGGYLTDNVIPPPVFDWPWTLPEYIYTSTIFAIWAQEGSDMVVFISMDKDWTSLYGETIIVFGDVQVGGETLAIHGERVAKPIPTDVYESFTALYGFEIVRGFKITADSPATGTALVMTPYGSPSTNLHIKTKSEIPRIPHSEWPNTDSLNLSYIETTSGSKTVKLHAANVWSTLLYPGVAFIEVVVDESGAQANPWPTISGYRLVTAFSGFDNNVLSIEANEEATETEFYIPGWDNGVPHAGSNGVRYNNVTFRVQDAAFEV